MTLTPTKSLPLWKPVLWVALAAPFWAGLYAVAF